jgi:hypothetical protein
VLKRTINLCDRNVKFRLTELHTACSRHTAKSLLVLYFILLLGQLPFRYQTTRTLQAIAENEVQYILTHGK